MSDDRRDERHDRPEDEEDPGVLLPDPEELAELADGDLMPHAVAVLAELKDRGLLHVLLRNRPQLGTLFEADEIRVANGAVEVIPEGLHAETPDDYTNWVLEAEALEADLSAPETGAAEAETLVREASSEALLLALESLQEHEDEEGPPVAEGDGPAGTDSSGADLPPTIRIGAELMRRGALQAPPEAG